MSTYAISTTPTPRRAKVIARVNSVCASLGFLCLTSSLPFARCAKDPIQYSWSPDSPIRAKAVSTLTSHVRQSLWSLAISAELPVRSRRRGWIELATKLPGPSEEIDGRGVIAQPTGGRSEQVRSKRVVARATVERHDLFR